MWHGYFVVERNTVGIGNWQALLLLFDQMGTKESIYPAYNNHFRTRLDGNAKIYESLFEPEGVSIHDFKHFLADEFIVAFDDIGDTQFVESYADYDSNVWVFSYPVGGDDRFTVRRFGRGGTWEESWNECEGYLTMNLNQWETGD